VRHRALEIEYCGHGYSVGNSSYSKDDGDRDDELGVNCVYRAVT
jgi:hypothetical protein